MKVLLTLLSRMTVEVDLEKNNQVDIGGTSTYMSDYTLRLLGRLNALPQ
jgi:hypothetical protein